MGDGLQKKDYLDHSVIKGVSVLKEILKASKKLGCKVLTVYAFSTENWSRPTKEVDFLINLEDHFEINFDLI